MRFSKNRAAIYCDANVSPLYSSFSFSVIFSCFFFLITKVTATTIEAAATAPTAITLHSGNGNVWAMDSVSNTSPQTVHFFTRSPCRNASAFFYFPFSGFMTCCFDFFLVAVSTGGAGINRFPGFGTGRVHCLCKLPCRFIIFCRSEILLPDVRTSVVVFKLIHSIGVKSRNLYGRADSVYFQFRSGRIGVIYRCIIVNNNVCTAYRFIFCRLFLLFGFRCSRLCALCCLAAAFRYYLFNCFCRVNNFFCSKI